MFLLEMATGASIIYHLEASARARHQSCLLLFGSSDLLIPKVRLMDYSPYLWVKFNQYLEGFMFFLHCMQDYRAGTERKKGGVGMEGGNWQSKTDDWQVKSHYLNWGNDSSQVQCWELRLCIKPSTWDDYISLQPLIASTLFIWPAIMEGKGNVNWNTAQQQGMFFKNKSTDELCGKKWVKKKGVLKQHYIIGKQTKAPVREMFQMPTDTDSSGRRKVKCVWWHLRNGF